MIYRDNLTFDPNQLRPAFRIGFARSKAQHLKIYLGEGWDRPVVEGPHFDIVTMDRNELESMPGFRYFG